MKLTNFEKETIIRFDDESDKAIIYTCNRSWMTKLEKLSIGNKLFKLKEKDSDSVTYEFPKSLITIRSKKVERNLSEEEREVLADRMRKNLGILD